MAKVITVSRTYPAYHPKKGQPTYFVEKIARSFPDNEDYTFYYNFIRKISEIGISGWYNLKPKHQTIRSGRRWKTGDIASIRIWGNDINPKSGRIGPYHSKQITIAPDVEVTVYDFEIKKDEDHVIVEIDGWCFYEENNEMICQNDAFITLAQNDGLTLEDLKAWFKYPKPFSGQIICWNQEIKY